MEQMRAFLQFSLLVLCALPMFADELSRHQGWYGEIPARLGDERFQRIYVQDGTLFHEDGSEVALWGVNFQSAMSWEWRISNRGKGWRHKFDADAWKARIDRGFDEIQLMGCEVIRIHLCPGDLADGKGDLLEGEWLDMLDYTMAECFRRGLYINFAFLNHLGEGGEEAILSSKLKEHKWEAMVLPQKIEASENYIRQLVDRPNPYDANRPYKHNPAWIVAEIMNEPSWPREKPSAEQFPDGIQIYDAWLDANQAHDSQESWLSFKTESIRNYINRMDALLYGAQLPAVPCWNLYWSQGPRHEGWEAYDAAAGSTVPIVSFSTYPGQNDSVRGIDLSDRNYLPYLQQSYDNADWQGWLQQDRFKGKKAAIVYEFETWHNQSTYLYPAMAKYFRAQGAQVATMWTYYLNEPGEARGRTASHNLNVVTTPRKAASFMVAKEVFKHTPRYLPYKVTDADADRIGDAALSFPLDLSAYANGDDLIYSGDIGHDFIEIPGLPKRIAGYGSSPFVEYQGQGLYFLEAVFEQGEFAFRWNLKVMPHARFAGARAANSEGMAVVKHSSVALNVDTAVPMTLRMPGISPLHWEVYRVEAGEQMPVGVGAPVFTFQVTPGAYVIQAR